MSNPMSTTTVRLDARLREALAVLTRDGDTQSEAIRKAILVAEKQARRDEMRRWALEISQDPGELAEAEAVQDLMTDDIDKAADAR
jgi:Arc/MetJ-type ribon-helix-helix transcriptional regulator